MDFERRLTVFTRGGVSVRAKYDFHATPRFLELFKRSGGTMHSLRRLLDRTLALLIRFGGPPRGRHAILKLVLDVDVRMPASKPYRGSYERGVARIWVNPVGSSYGEYRHYAYRPLLPSVRVDTLPQTIVAAVAHEASHWLSLGRENHLYWRSRQAKDGTEGICDLMSIVAMETVFRSERRLEKT
jgi:hypothetical protein